MSTKEEKLGVALVGAGIWATKALLPSILKNDHSCVLKAIYSRTESSATKLAKSPSLQKQQQSSAEGDGGGISVYFGDDQFKQMLSRNDIDAVIVALPFLVQPDVVSQVLAAGKHCLSEKPIAVTTVQARKLIEQYEKSFMNRGLVWHIGECMRFEDSLKHAKQVIREKLGSVAVATITFCRAMNSDIPYYHCEWRTSGEYEGGWLLDIGIHQIATVRYVLDCGMSGVAAVGKLVKDDLKPVDTANAVFRMDGGSSVTYNFTLAASAKVPAENRLQVIGTNGRVTVFPDRRKDANGNMYGAWVVQEDIHGVQDEQEFSMCGVEREITHFLDCVSKSKQGKGGATSNDIRQAFEDVAAMEALLKSIDSSAFENVSHY